MCKLLIMAIESLTLGFANGATAAVLIQPSFDATFDLPLANAQDFMADDFG